MANFDPNSGEFQVNSFTENQQWLPSVTSLKDGGFVVVWQSTGQDGSEGGIYGQRYNAGGTATSEEQRILYNTTTGALFYDADGNGEGVAVQFATLENKAELKASDFTVVAIG